MKEQMKAILTKGLIASGKSTWAKQFVKENNSYIRISRDDFRHMLDGYSFSDETEKLINQLMDNSINVAKSNKKSIIIDEQHLNQERLEQRVKQLKDMGYEIIIKEFPISLSDAIKRDSLRQFSIGEKVIRRTWRRYEKELKDMLDRTKIRFISNKDMPKAYIFDIDGTVALQGDRDIYDGSKVHLDIPIMEVLEIARALYRAGYQIIFLSGRDGKFYNQTFEWLSKHFNSELNSFLLFMRKAGDSRKDAIIKKEIFYDRIANYYNVMGVFDDRPQVLRLWQNEIGLWTFAVNQDVDCKNDF